MAAKIAVVGDINQDFVMRAERMPRPGETRTADDLNFVPGGKGANQAVVAARLGAEATMIGAVGDDPFGPQLVANLERDGVCTDHVIHVEGVTSGYAFIALAPSGENSILRVMGAALHCTPELVDSAADAIAEADVLLVQLGVSIETVLRAMQIADEAATAVVFDPAPVCDGLEGMWPLTTIATPNEMEAWDITGIEVTDLASAAAAAAWLGEHGVATGMVTLGAEGCVIADEDGARLVRGYEIEVVDTTGAGDAFAGALGVRIAEGAPMDEAAAFANAAGAISASKFGAQPSLPYRDEVEELMAEQERPERVQHL